MKTSLLIALLLLILLHGCKPDKPAITNPYDSINRSDNNNTYNDTVPDPASITGIYKNILSVKCANPGCHDGHFEPDFRTIQSSYATLVYAPVKKHTSDSAFTWRVKPNDVNKSWFHQRLITDDPVLGRMPLYSTPLSDTELEHIRTWINRGAPAADGSLPVKPNTLPVIEAFIVTTLSGIRVDTIREEGVSYNPMLLPKDSALIFYFLVKDDETPSSALTQNLMKVSTDIEDFTNATSYPASFLTIGSFQVWRIQMNANAYPANAQRFLRYYVGDGVNTGVTEFPNNESLLLIKNFASFKLVP
jgi:hypothetical protein